MTQDGLDSADTTSALAYLRMLSAEPDAAKLRSLHEALDSQPPSSSWFASFLALDGAQALLDVLSHSQTRATHLAEEDEVQVQCVSCIMAVIRR